MTTRTETDKWTSWYLSMVFAGVDPLEAQEIIESMRADEEALKVPSPAG